ncbi:sigma-54-dependent transcriptional regulator [Kineobactrum salinum]|uniref:Sigma-54-dependent Fis family transcriptional regulator n=1 Tax=Kineobactrum salinum TaxID=2708301 RepID=A0A6C0U3N5_9GAMM|nr:sigma 54-interacting transcriptional regulator [Kineobactrum salinum]QIB66636.1 sigma-54-dependent Fis family transcriptional regulator [Kineobactrum salinum]
MPERFRTDATLPSVFPGPAASRSRMDLVLTIVFHPDTGRIGERCSVPAGNAELLLGRQHPDFARLSATTGVPLGDPHLSRRALGLSRRTAALLLRRPADSCACRVDGEWLSGECELDSARLQRGVILQLAHSVVLLLRQAEAVAPGMQAAGTAGLLGSSAYMYSLREQLTRTAHSGLDVLISGETGTGKELVARAVHACSARAERPLVAVNMAAIPVGVAPAALFGSARGAFTGADRASSGYFQQAAGGSLFLDEVGDTPEHVQPQLLRALQEREIQPVGGTPERVDVRVISATEAELDAADSGFRSALRHRLGSARLRLAPLREHPEDIGELLCHFLRQACAETGTPPMLPDPASDPVAVARWADLFYSCQRHSWPGNIRELANCARQVVLDSAADPRTPVLVLPQSPAAVAESAGGRPEQPVQLGDEALRSLLEQEHYEISRAARRAGMSRQALYRRLPQLGLRLASQVPTGELQRALHSCGGDAAQAAGHLRVSAVALRARLRSSAANARPEPDHGD